MFHMRHSVQTLPVISMTSVSQQLLKDCLRFIQEFFTVLNVVNKQAFYLAYALNASSETNESFNFRKKQNITTVATVIWGYSVGAIAKALPVMACSYILSSILCKITDCSHMKTHPARNIKMIIDCMGQLSALS